MIQDNVYAVMFLMTFRLATLCKHKQRETNVASVFCFARSTDILKINAKGKGENLRNYFYFR